MQVLLVEDDDSLAKGLTKALHHEGFTVNHLSSGQQSIHAVELMTPDMVILDLGLPDMDGNEVLKQIRLKDPEIPVLILTARTTLEDKVIGLDNGADDYLAKPFDMDELLARLRVFERRLSSLKHAELVVGTVSIDTKAQIASVENDPIDLPRREFMLLKMLMENVGRVLTRDSLESKLYAWGDEVASNTIEVHIHHLRKKLPHNYIKTVRGVGYTIRS